MVGQIKSSLISPPDKRKTKMWDTIFDICRVNQKDPVSAWQDHIYQLAARNNYLNHKQYNTLKLIAPGTDLIIGFQRDIFGKVVA